MTKSGKYKKYAIIGMIIMTMGMLSMSYMNSIAMAVIIMIIFGMGLGFGMPVFTLAAQNAVKPSELGVVTASSQLFRNLGGTIGITVMGSIMTSQLASNLKGATSGGPDISNVDPSVLKQLEPFLNPQLLLDRPRMEQLQAALPENIQPIAAQLIDMLRQALNSSLTTVFLIGTAIVAVALLLVLFMKEIPLRSSNSDSTKEKEDNEDFEELPLPVPFKA